MSYDKVVDSSALDASLTAVADAIREKTGKTATMTLAEMPTEIENISGGGGDTSMEDGIVARTISGEYTNDRVTKVGNYAFYGCSKLTSVSFPNADTISNYAFYRCSALASVDFPLVGDIGAQAFQTCEALTSVSFPKAYTIRSQAFYYCSALTTADFPIAMIIEASAFQNCSALGTLVLRRSTVCSLKSKNALYSTLIKSGTGYIYVPDALVDSYKTATNWSTYAAQIKPLSEYTGG